ncbi:hypothetical protein [Dyella nitratireducens]|uniref:NHL repeat containing protein n=1 Tax=Dyella nitratireducens TaxID=1849580 RepID=A0ABQ1FTE0_9GAMM|nr:hypothetical protein [Dyella nitratireducens]GGA28734.1 hypothetical protein GCM10010981_16940 [Dyella nitratireducens]GLQ43241.1 hypothetical protein GCM10007902_30910 [Dyella nitratireducens]
MLGKSIAIAVLTSVALFLRPTQAADERCFKTIQVPKYQLAEVPFVALPDQHSDSMQLASVQLADGGTCALLNSDRAHNYERVLCKDARGVTKSSAALQPGFGAVATFSKTGVAVLVGRKVWNGPVLMFVAYTDGHINGPYSGGNGATNGAQPQFLSDGTTLLPLNGGYLFVRPNGNTFTFVPKNNVTVFSAAVMGDDTSVFGSTNGSIYVVNSDGSVQNIISDRPGSFSQPAVEADGTVVLTDDDSVQLLSQDGLLKTKYVMPSEGGLTFGPLIMLNGNVVISNALGVAVLGNDGSFIDYFKIPGSDGPATNHQWIVPPRLAPDGTIDMTVYKSRGGTFPLAVKLQQVPGQFNERHVQIPGVCRN